MIELKTPEGYTPPAKEDFLSIDGKIYQVDEEFSANFAISYMEVSLKNSVDAANLWLLEEALGPEGYVALRSWSALKPEQLGDILDQLISRVNKAMEPGKA